ncbi:ankyrin [Ustulina deusta]|nr:ankyrin [Ustulina deusta]
MNPSLRNDNQYTALHIFAHMGDAPMVRFLLGHGAEIDARDRDSCTPLHWAAWAGKLESTKGLLKGNADVNAKDRRDRTALFGAAGGGYTEVVEFLLSYNANRSIRGGTNQQTPLERAIHRNRTTVIELLREL